MSELVVGSLKGLSANSFEIDIAAGSTLDLVNAKAGSIPKAALPSGSILQVVSTNTTTATSTTAATPQPTSCTASITPTSATSKIFVIAQVERAVANSSAQATILKLFRGSVAGTQIAAGGHAQNNAAAIVVGQAVMGVDSPATTSSTTYVLSVQSSSAGQTSSVNENQNMILLEVAG